MPAERLASGRDLWRFASFLPEVRLREVRLYLVLLIFRRIHSVVDTDILGISL